MEILGYCIVAALILISLIGGPISATLKEESRVIEHCEKAGVVIIRERVFACSERKTK